jgi:hypothetical protein
VSTWRALSIPLLLSVASVVGIVAMLVFDGVIDIAAFVLAALPLAVGVGALVRRERGKRS